MADTDSSSITRTTDDFVKAVEAPGMQITNCRFENCTVGNPIITKRDVDDPIFGSHLCKAWTSLKKLWRS